MSAVLKMSIDEQVRLDRDQIEVLYRQLGAVGADKVVNHALEELAVMLSRVGKQYRESDFKELAAGARALAAVARQIGMTLLARVARDAELLSQSGDGVALGAVVARMERIGDRSLVAVWDLQDLSV